MWSKYASGSVPTRPNVSLAAIVGVPLLMCGCATAAAPVTDRQVRQFAGKLGKQVSSRDTMPKVTLDAELAVTRAMSANTTILVKELEVSLAAARARSLEGELLPKFISESKYYRRNTPLMTRSSPSTAYTSSTSQRTLTRDVTLSWNILDFGLSYVRARQGLDKAHYQAEELRRIRARIAEETKNAYWNAVALDILEPKLESLDRDVGDALAAAELAGKNDNLDPTIGINLQRDILNLQRDINQVHASLSGSKDKLKHLIGLTADERLTMKRTRQHSWPVPSGSTVQDDVAVSLRQRSEIRQHMYDLRITRDEVHATILQALPSVNFDRALSSSSDSHLLYQNWVGIGAHLATNLMNLVRLPRNLETVEEQAKVHRQSALATAAMIAMQVHVARAKHALARRAYRDASRYAVVQKAFLRQVGLAVDAGRTGRQALVKEQLATLLAEVRAVLAFGEVEAAIAALLSARGDEPWLQQMPLNPPVPSVNDRVAANAAPK